MKQVVVRSKGFLCPVWGESLVTDDPPSGAMFPQWDECPKQLMLDTLLLPSTDSWNDVSTSPSWEASVFA
jgi:hypothetical protein